MKKSIPSGNVFLFEDDTAVRDAIAQSLELEGFNVTAFESVESCSVRFGPDLDGVVVTDIRLPGADGRQLFRKLAEVDPDLPVILITGHGELQEAVDLMREGAYDFISKPFSPSRLLTSVRNAIDYRRLVLENRKTRSNSRDVGKYQICGRSFGKLPTRMSASSSSGKPEPERSRSRHRSINCHTEPQGHSPLSIAPHSQNL
ncbi:MAG: sigma-54-dependent Fis family transcriptional regulator [Gammaproteobacteria bacterium]|nr:sigma-54-dependent Fis family transcriptional regulator [Gammaproteobacteria bacterium]